MGLAMRDNGKMDMHGAKENLFIQLVIFMMVIGEEIKLVVKVCINLLKMEEHILENGKMTCKKDMGLKHGKMEVIMRDNFHKVRNME